MLSQGYQPKKGSGEFKAPPKNPNGNGIAIIDFQQAMSLMELDKPMHSPSVMSKDTYIALRIRNGMKYLVLGYRDLEEQWKERPLTNIPTDLLFAKDFKWLIVMD